MKALLVIALAATLGAAEPIPSWVQDAAQTPVSAFPPKISAVVLLQEEQLTVGQEGQRTIRERGVIRIVQTSRNRISAFRAYNAKTGKIREMQAWFLPAAGKVVTLKKEQATDFALSPSDAYTEYRAKSLECPVGAAAGSVFAWEIVEEEKSVFTQYSYDFQDRSPVLVSRFSLTVPPGFEVKSVPFHRLGLEPTVVGTTHTWELRDLAPVEDEEYSPSVHSIAPWVGVTWFGAGTAARGLKDWHAVSAWVSELVDPAAVVTPAITAKAAELVREAMTETDRIRAVAEFVQKTNYVSIQINLNRGGGYTPHPAQDVLSKNYGDCKDKSTLMRALLKSIGIDSYMTAIYAGDRHHVQPEWPSPQPFNHAIVAVRVSDGTAAATVIEHAALGRLMFFDPTASRTAFGDLPLEEQGSYALILAGVQGDLVRMPLSPASANRVETEVEGRLDLDTAFTGKLVRRYFGQAASAMRRSSDDATELKKIFETAFSRRLGGVTLSRVTGADETEHYRANVDFAVNQFGQVLQGRLVVIRPGKVLAGNDYGFSPKERKLPIRLPARVRKDSVQIRISAGFAVDELPDPLELKSDYGNYRAEWKANADQILFEQSVDFRDSEAPAADYAKVRQFFDKVAAAQSGAVVLLKR